MTGSGTATLATPITAIARDTMADLIAVVRGFCNIGTNDYTLGTTAYWSDDQVQTALERHKTTVRRDLLRYVTDYVGGGTVEYKKYFSAYGNYEHTDGGTSVFVIQDALGDVILNDEYTVDYPNGIVTFEQNQGGSSRFLTGRSYDIYSAAADVWRMKASAYGEAVSFKTDNMSVNRSDLIKNCFSMANMYAGLGKAKTTTLTREDCE